MKALDPWLVARLKVHAPWRRWWGGRPVHREVQGVALWMPWSHRLPDYAAAVPAYGQNLVEFAARLVPGGEELLVLDVGANIGDSTLQILDRVPGRVLAVEADSFYLPFLRRNASSRDDVTIAPVLLTTGPADSRSWVASRSGGTTHFLETGGQGGTGAAVAERPSPEAATAVNLAIADLARVYPEFADMRLVKSDTDGYDTELIAELAATYAASRPALFFEYDPALTARVSGNVAAAVWPTLADLGYAWVGIWDNFGEPVALTSVTEVAAVAEARLRASKDGAYLDVAVVHADDTAGLAGLQELFAHVAAAAE